MKIIIETNRLILREFLPSDDIGLFELDSDEEVHRYLGSNPVKNIDECREIIENITKQYQTIGFGRWALIEKSTNNLLGWSGLKMVKELTNNHKDYCDIGYRLIKKYWGNGFATESAKASLDYGFEILKLQEIFGSAEKGNVASRQVLEKIGLKYIETFDFNGIQADWFRKGNPNAAE